MKGWIMLVTGPIRKSAKICGGVSLRPLSLILTKPSPLPAIQSLGVRQHLSAH